MIERIFFRSLAAIAAAWLAPSVYAAGGGGVGSSSGTGSSGSASGGHTGGGSGFHSAAVAHFSSSSGGGHSSHISNFTTRSVVGASAVPSVVHASTAAAPAIIAGASPAAAPTVNVNGAFAPAQTSDPTVAFGGSTTALHGGGRAFSPSGNVTQNWDRNRPHTWNHHRYRYRNGGWIYWDDGFPDDYFGNTDNDQAPNPPYPPLVNGVLNNGQPAANGSASEDSANNDQPSANKSPASDGSDYGTPDTLVVSVQDALTHQGYATGGSNGTFGPMTKTALSNFQRDHQLPITGHIDGMTLKALGLL